MSKAFTYGDNGEVLVTTTTGWTVQCLGVAAQYQRVGETVIDPPRPEPPTYTMIDAAGETQDFPHDEKSIQDLKTSDEEREAWDAYQDALAQWEVDVAEAERERTDMRASFIVLKGIKVLDPLPDLDVWAEEQRSLFGMDIQTTGVELRRDFLLCEVVVSKADGQNVALGMFRASGVDEEAIDAAEATFRDSLGRTGGADIADAEGEAEAGE